MRPQQTTGWCVNCKWIQLTLTDTIHIYATTREWCCAHNTKTADIQFIPRRDCKWHFETNGNEAKVVHVSSGERMYHKQDKTSKNCTTLHDSHERSGRLDIAHDVINVSDSSQTRSAHESETFNVGDETLRNRTERSIADHDVSHKSIMVNEADMDFRIPGLPHSVVKHAQSTSVRELIQKIENHPDRHALQQDLRQKQSFYLFIQDQNKWSRMLGTSNYVNCSRRNPKRSAQCVYHIGIPDFSTARAGISCIKKEGTIKNSMDLLSVPEYVIKKGRPHGHRYGKSRDTEYYTANQLKKKCKKRDFQGIHDLFLRDRKIRIRMIENHRDKDLCRRWDALADEDHTHHLTAQEYLHWRAIGGFIQISKVLTLCHWGIDLISSRHCLRCMTPDADMMQSWKLPDSYNTVTVNGENVKTTPQMTRFRDAKVCNNRLQIRIDDHRIQSGYKYKKWTTKSRRTEFCYWFYVCVVKPSTTPMTTRPPRPRTPSTRRTWTLTRECAVLLFVSQVLVVMIHTLHPLAQGCCACHLIHAWSVRFSFDLESSIPFYFFIFSFILYLLHFLLHYLRGRSKPPPRRVWTLLTRPTSSQVMSPTPTTSRRLTSSPTQSPWPTHSSPSKGSSRTWSTMTPHSRICFAKHTEYMSTTPSEKACLSVVRRRPCPSERGDLLDQLVRS